MEGAPRRSWNAAEDAFVLHDPQAVTQLFHPGAMPVAGSGLPEARGHQQITRVATQLWDSQQGAGP
jgi:hypothetical protein